MNIPLKRYLELLATYLRPQQGRVAVLAVLLFSGIGLQLLNPQILRQFIDTATAQAEPGLLTMRALAFIGVALLGQACAVAVTYFSQNVAWTATNALRADLAAHCLRLDMAFHKARTPGELIERVDGDVNQLSTFFSQFVINLFGSLVLMIGVLVILFRENWLVGVGLSLFAVVALGILLRMRDIATPHWDRVREQNAQFYGFVGEQLAGTEDVRSSGATGYVMNRFYTMLRVWLPLTRTANVAGYGIWLTTLALFGFGNAIAFALSAYLWNQNAITIGTAYLIFYYTELLRQPIEQLRTQLQELQKANASISRVTALFNSEATIRDGIGTPLPAGALAVEMRGVSFDYEDERPDVGGQRSEDKETRRQGEGEAGPTPHLPPPEFQTSVLNSQSSVLSSISFRLEPGRVLGLLGRTGSGKTTLSRLLLRLYDPTSGVVLLGGVPLGEARLADVRQRVGVVTQDVQLFNATVRDNLTFFDATIADARIIDVLNDLGMGSWFQSLPLGLDTELEGGGSLSAGEAQLLAFARLFLLDPGLVILDEASSRLDPATERLIERAVGKLLQGRTGIIIAHRLATVQRADEIMILERGEIVEHGQRTLLSVEPDSRFAELMRTGMEEVLV